MTNKIKELMDKVAKSDAKLSELLRHAMLITKKHNNQNFLSWIELEMNGYENNENLPEYRYVRGTPKMQHPYTNEWVDYNAQNSKMQEVMSRLFIGNPIAHLESLIETPKEGYLFIPYPAGAQEMLSKTTTPSVAKFALNIPISSIIGVLGVIRNNLLNQLSDSDANTEDNSNTELLGEFFPPKLMSRLPTDIRQLADDFNFNFSHNRPYACILILRRTLPLSIVRKYEQDGKTQDIKNKGEFLETKALLEEAQSLIQKRLYKDLLSCKMLLDASQHSYSISIEIDDVQKTAMALRLFLGALFSENTN